MNYGPANIRNGSKADISYLFGVATNVATARASCGESRKPRPV